MDIKIKNPCSYIFETGGKPLFIYCDNGLLYHKRIDEKPIRVNFPVPGKYTTLSEKFTVAPIIKYKPLAVPEKEKNIVKPHKIILESGSPYLARTYVKKGITVVNDKFETLPYQYKVFILLHEKGHQFYFDESKCDSFAVSKYLNAGFNKSQLEFCAKEVLSANSQNKKRILNILNDLDKTTYTE